ncbi:RDD family protein [Flaviaesturariibacter terrae]
MSTIHIPTSFNISITFPAAPFHRRLGAWLIDIVVLVLYYWILFHLFTGYEVGLGRNTGNNEIPTAIFWFLAVVPPLTYHPLCELVFGGQSLGKRLLGLRVINDRGGRPSVSQVLIRWVIRTSDFMVVIIMLSSAAGGGAQMVTQAGVAFGLLVLDIILVNVTPRQQRLGDILAHTLLIRTKQKAGIDETIFQHVKDSYTPQFPQVLQLSDRDINAIKNILDSAQKHHDYGLADRAAEKIKGHLNISNSMSPFEFLAVLLKDYNYLTTH